MARKIAPVLILQNISLIDESVKIASFLLEKYSNIWYNKDHTFMKSVKALWAFLPVFLYSKRTAGCAAAILEHFYRRGIDIFANSKYYPNQVIYHKVFDALESAAFQSTEYLQRVYDYSGTKFPFDRNVVEESLNRLPQTKRDILYMYLWERQSMASIARLVGFENLRIEQILAVCHRKLAHYIADSIRR